MFSGLQEKGQGCTMLHGNTQPDWK